MSCVRITTWSISGYRVVTTRVFRWSLVAHFYAIAVSAFNFDPTILVEAEVIS